MADRAWLAEIFEEHRNHLRGVAYRMLGSFTEAEDAVQESWLRLHRAGVEDVANPRAWLTTVVSRVCLDLLRSRKSRREDALDTSPGDPPAPAATRSNPEQEALLADSVGLALLVVLDRLNTAERIAFVLHDIFDIPFDQIAVILGRSTVATRQIASRARRRVHGAQLASRQDLAEQYQLIHQFLAALRAGDLTTLISLLDPDLIVHADLAAGLPAGATEVRGAEHWAKQAVTFARGAVFARPALVNGTAGVIVAPRGRLFRALQFSFLNGRIAAIQVIADPNHLRALDVALPAEN